MTKEVKALRAQGGMTSTQVARLLGIGLTTLRRLEGTVYEAPKRVGGRAIRVFTAEAVARVREWLARKVADSGES
jgi:hypothetical protein